MRRDSPVIAFSLASLIILGAAAASVPASEWHRASVLTRFAPGLVDRMAGHGWVATRAMSTAVFHAPAALRSNQPMHHDPAPPTSVCRSERGRLVCAQGECRRVWLQRRIQLLLGITG
jgi:hypothetical protein